MSSELLPTNATHWERAVADAMRVPVNTASAITAMRRVKYVSPRPSMLPFLVWEYGLGELTPYVPNLYQLIDEGVRWQRLRGTVSAVAIGLGWIGYAAEIEEAWTGRRWWNSFQLRFSALPAHDHPDLERIEGITRLSVPKRSDLRRGVHHYDVGALEADHSVLDGAMLDFESGIAITEAGTIWSFGRTHEFNHVLTEAEGLAIGNWLNPPEGDGLLWAEMDHILWVDADYLWADTPEAQRAAALAGWFTARPLHMRLTREDGSVIGYRRCRTVRAVRPEMDGAYLFEGTHYEPHPAGEALYVEALTQFDDAQEAVCTFVELMVGAELAPDVSAGRLWLEPHEVVAGTPIGRQAMQVQLRPTVREQIKFLVRF